MRASPRHATTREHVETKFFPRCTFRAETQPRPCLTAILTFAATLGKMGQGPEARIILLHTHTDSLPLYGEDMLGRFVDPQLR